MKKGEWIYQQYLNILQEELRPAMGCTEPIALALAGAKAKALLGCLPDRVDIRVSGNIIKNVKSVIVPNTGGMHGIGPAVCAGIVAGDAEQELQVISGMTPGQQQELEVFLKQTKITIQPADSELVFDIDLRLYAGDDQARIRVINHHTNVVYMEKNGQVLLNLPVQESSEDRLTDKSCLCFEKIVEFAETVDIEDIRELVGQQIQYNMAIARTGLQGDWGANVGRVILRCQGELLSKKAAAYAAAGSDARMSGCEMPVISLSGSGNQGITASVPVAVYAEELGKSEEELLRAVVLSDLVTIHQKTGIGRLSAFCGAICAGCGAGAGIAFLQGGRLHAVAHAVVNAVAILSGTICDGAKPSCAMKCASGVSTAVVSALMAMNNRCVKSVEGIIDDDVDRSIRNLTDIGRDAMTHTDAMILRIMTSKS